MNLPEVGSIFRIKGQICYVFHCDGIFRIEEISNRTNLKSGWFQNGEQNQIHLTQKWLDLLKEFHVNYEETNDGYRYDLNSTYLKHCNHRFLNDYLFQEYDLKRIYDFSVEQSMTNPNNHIYIYARLKKEVYDRICSEFC